jgi:superoxide reductase
MTAEGRRDFLRTTFLTSGLLLTGSLAQAAGGTLRGYAAVEPELFQGINRVKEPGKPTPLEQKHAPLLLLPEKIRSGEPFEVTVKVGEVLHPMSPAHSIQYVELLAGNEPAGRVEFAPGFNQPQATFVLRLDRVVTLVAREYCNLHGLWETRQDLVLS